MLNNVYIPYGAYYSSPFAKWQGSLQNENSIPIGCTYQQGGFLKRRGLDAGLIEYL